MRTIGWLWLLAGCMAWAQATPGAQPQTGVIMRRPGEPIRGPVAVPVPPPKPNLTPAVLASFRGTILLRRESGIFLVRSGDKTARRVLDDAYAASLSPDGRQIACFMKSKIHLLTLAEGATLQADTVLEELPEARVGEIAWSPDGEKIGYEVHAKAGYGVHVVNVATHEVRNVGPGAGTISFSADSASLLVTGAKEGLLRYRLTDGGTEVAYRSAYPPNWSARISPKGWVGVLVPVPDAPGAEPADDEPDCRGAQLELDLVDPSGKHSTAAFPEEFDDVYDFEFSPDGAQALVGFGNVGCDYPGDSGAVYLVPLSGSAPRRLTPKDHIALKGHFSPDGQQVAYTDFINGGSPSVFIVGVNGGKAMPLVAPDQYGDDEVLDWR